MIGKSPRRKEDERLITGRGRYVDDVTLPNLQHLVIVRSPHARARIVSVDASGATSMAGVSVFVGEDLPELGNALPTFVEPASNPYCDLNSPPPQLALARGQVRHVGEAVVAVVADDRYRAADAAEAIRIKYEPLPAVVDAERAMAEGAPRVHAGRSNVVGHIKVSIGAVERAFARADVVVEERLSYARVTSMPIEPRAVCARFDPVTGLMTVWAGHQMPYMLRDAVARFLKLPAENVRVICPDTGGGFGPKAAVYPEELLVPVLAYHLRKPVKWIQTRSEFMVSSQHAREQLHDARLAATRDGTILGLDVRIIKDVGAYYCWAVIDPTNSVNHLPAHYKIPNIRAEGFCVVTDKVPSSPYRGAGRPEAVFVMDRLLDLLARKLGIGARDRLRPGVRRVSRRPVRGHPRPWRRHGAPALRLRDRGQPGRGEHGKRGRGCSGGCQAQPHDRGRPGAGRLRPQGLGVALGECLVYDDAGQLLTGSLMDYPIPRADDIPEFVTEHLHFATDHNRLGTRGVGEGPTGPPPAAIANAVADAFDGRLNLRFPVLTPARVHALLRESGITNPNHVYNSS